MSQQQSKKFRKTFNKNFKEQLTETASKIVTDKIIKQLKEKDDEIFYIARQRDVMFILNILSICGIITIGILLIKELIK